MARLSPLKWRHIRMLGSYNFVLSPGVAGVALRPLRDPGLGWVDNAEGEDGNLKDD